MLSAVGEEEPTEGDVELDTDGVAVPPGFCVSTDAFARFMDERYKRWVGDPDGGHFDSPALGVRMINTSRGAQPRPDMTPLVYSTSASPATPQDSSEAR